MRVETREILTKGSKPRLVVGIPASSCLRLKEGSVQGVGKSTAIVGFDWPSLKYQPTREYVVPKAR